LEFRIWENIVSRINSEYMKKNITRNISYKDLIGCDEDQLLEHLKLTIPESLTFDDYPKWVPDHIIPVSSFDLSNDEKAKECFNYMNLQSLTKEQNAIKYNKIL
jgi:hypothetical protein